MEREDISCDQFAKWSFERDKKNRVLDSDLSWEDLDTCQRQAYLDEANFYLFRCSKLPEDIQILLKEKNDLSSSS